MFYPSLDRPPDWPFPVAPAVVPRDLGPRRPRRRRRRRRRPRRRTETGAARTVAGRAAVVVVPVAAVIPVLVRAPTVVPARRRGTSGGGTSERERAPPGRCQTSALGGQGHAAARDARRCTGARHDLAVVSVVMPLRVSLRKISKRLTLSLIKLCRSCEDPESVRSVRRPGQRHACLKCGSWRWNGDKVYLRSGGSVSGRIRRAELDGRARHQHLPC